jgi:hypothetical protein
MVMAPPTPAHEVMADPTVRAGSRCLLGALDADVVTVWLAQRVRVQVAVTECWAVAQRRGPDVYAPVRNGWTAWVCPVLCTSHLLSVT